MIEIKSQDTGNVAFKNLKNLESYLQFRPKL